MNKCQGATKDGQVLVFATLGVILDLEVKKGQLRHLGNKSEGLVPTRVEAIVAHSLRLALVDFRVAVLDIVRMASQADLDVRIDDVVRALRLGNVLPAENID